MLERAGPAHARGSARARARRQFRRPVAVPAEPSQHQPDADEFPDFDDNLRMAWSREVELLFESVVREDRGVVDLMTADYTFVNERLARHYGIPNVYGSHFRRVRLSDDERRGLWARAASCSSRRSRTARHRSFAASGCSRTSSARRRRRRPGDVPPLRRTSAEGAPRSRERIRSASREPGVRRRATRVMDPIGFALEKFDAVGDGGRSDGGTLGMRSRGTAHGRQHG